MRNKKDYAAHGPKRREENKFKAATPAILNLEAVKIDASNVSELNPSDIPEQFSLRRANILKNSTCKIGKLLDLVPEYKKLETVNINPLHKVVL